MLRARSLTTEYHPNRPPVFARPCALLFRRAGRWQSRNIDNNSIEAMNTQTPVAMNVVH